MEASTKVRFLQEASLRIVHFYFSVTWRSRSYKWSNYKNVNTNFVLVQKHHLGVTLSISHEIHLKVKVIAKIELKKYVYGGKKAGDLEKNSFSGMGFIKDCSYLFFVTFIRRSRSYKSSNYQKYNFFRRNETGGIKNPL